MKSKMRTAVSATDSPFHPTGGPGLDGASPAGAMSGSAAGATSG
jgi:hypothetical protein